MTTSGWDNVDTSTGAVSSTYIGMGPAQQSSAKIFSNNLHQVPVTLMISFKLIDPAQAGPSNGEIAAAITWVNYTSGMRSQTIKENPTINDYCVYYLPALVEKHQTPSASGYQNAVQFIFMASDVATPGISEQISYILKAKKTTGEDIVYDATNSIDGQGNSSASVYVTFIPAQRYGAPNNGQYPTFVPSLDQSNVPTSFDPVHGDYKNQSGRIWQVAIDDPAFYVRNATSSFGFPTPDDELVFIYRVKEQSRWNQYTNTYWLNKEYNPGIDQSIPDYSAKLYDKTNGENIGTVYATLTLHGRRLSFFDYSADVEGSPDDNDYYTANVPIHVYDQFGNQSIVTVFCDPAPNISSVVTP